MFLLCSSCFYFIFVFIMFFFSFLLTILLLLCPRFPTILLLPLIFIYYSCYCSSPCGFVLFFLCCFLFVFCLSSCCSLFGSTSVDYYSSSCFLFILIFLLVFLLFFFFVLFHVFQLPLSSSY